MQPWLIKRLDGISRFLPIWLMLCHFITKVLDSRSDFFYHFLLTMCTLLESFLHFCEASFFILFIILMLSTANDWCEIFQKCRLFQKSWPTFAFASQKGNIFHFNGHFGSSSSINGSLKAPSWRCIFARLSLFLFSLPFFSFIRSQKRVGFQSCSFFFFWPSFFCTLIFCLAASGSEGQNSFTGRWSSIICYTAPQWMFSWSFFLTNR